MRLRLLPLCLLAACATTPDVADAPPPPPPVPQLAEETRLKNVRQLTFGGENAEAYWAFEGGVLSLQRRTPDQGCDRIYTLDLRPQTPVLELVSSGKGATTCAHFLPGGKELIYASTHLAGDACPPKPDMSQGYVWALYDSYDIFKANADGTNVRRLTDTPGYDAEGTVCAKDGSVVFTSTRDGDIELYRMDADGKNVKRLTHTPGYDGGAFFNADCTKLVWRASRPKPGKELEEFQALLEQGLVRPSQLELYVANADGSDAQQVTYLGAASFAPFFFPDGRRILFSSNYGDPKHREFDIFAVNVDGTGLERITHTAGFDGFPMFSPDGKQLVFASNRMTAKGEHDTNLFLADWADGPPPVSEGPAERIKADVTWLASPDREGRGIGLEGLARAGAYLEDRFKALGLEPLGENGGYREPFEVTTKVTSTEATKLVVAKQAAAAGDFLPLGFSAQGAAKGKAVLVGFGLKDEALGLDDYKGLNVKGAVAVALRFAPEHEKLNTPELQRRAGDLRKKAFVARSQGAKALLVVDWPLKPKDAPADWAPPPEAPLPKLLPEGTGGDAGLPVLLVKRAALEQVMPQLLAKKRVDVDLAVGLAFEKTPAFNVVGVIRAGKKSADGPVVVGAHYDHLGLGGPKSLAPDSTAPHLGADDNASGAATLLEVARILTARKAELSRDVVVAAFSGEEAGVLGSTAMVQAKPKWLEGAVAMLNMDMVGRLRMNSLAVLGKDSAAEWGDLIEKVCEAQRVDCKASGDGYGPSDHMPFYTAGMPVLHFFTGAHNDYHKPSDSADKLNDVGMAKVADIVAGVALEAQGEKLTYQKVSSPPAQGDARSYGASLGTVPNYVGPPEGIKGVLLDDVRQGGGADQAGMRRGDIIVKLGTFDVGSVEDLMFVLMQAKPGETVTAVVLREGKPVKLETTFQAGRRR